MMSRKKKIVITAHDQSRLEDIFHSGFVEAFYDKPYLDDLRGEIDKAEIVEAEELPADVVTMHSTVREHRPFLTSAAAIHLSTRPQALARHGWLSLQSAAGALACGCMPLIQRSLTVADSCFCYFAPNRQLASAGDSLEAF